MANLMLSRKAGQSVRVGDLTITVNSIHRGDVTMSVGDTKFTLKMHQGFGIGLDAFVKVTDIRQGTVKLMFDAPLAVKIMRTELL